MAKSRTAVPVPLERTAETTEGYFIFPRNASLIFYLHLLGVQDRILLSIQIVIPERVWIGAADAVPDKYFLRPLITWKSHNLNLEKLFQFGIMSTEQSQSHRLEIRAQDP